VGVAAVVALSTWALARAGAAGDTPAGFDVGAAGAGRFRTVQEAVDAAKPGDVVRVGPGTFDGAVRIDKPLTLVGTGPTTTVLRADLALAGRDGDDLETARMRPTLRVDGTSGVVVREVGLTGRAPPVRGAVRTDAIVLVRAGGARFEHCAVYGSGASGVLVGTDAEARLEHCLVASLASDGVVLRGKRMSLVDCDVRDCVHYGVVFGRGTTGEVERCRLYGAQWHGVRYDDASPTIRGNAIFDNRRSGIYASGRTAATVEGNLFLRNTMSGVSCWTANGDAIRRNVFANGGREAVAVLGGSKPHLEGNVFLRNPTAVLSGKVAGQGAQAGTLDLVGNWFWKNADDASAPASEGTAVVPLDAKALDAGGNRREDPGLLPTDAGDLAWAKDAPARVAGAGADPLPSIASPWPADLGELARATAGWDAPPAAEAPAARPAEPRSPVAFTRARAWSDDLHSRPDAARRDRARREIADALEGRDPVGIEAAFRAIAMTRDVAWDRATLRPKVVAGLASVGTAAQVAGLAALAALGTEPGDVDLVVRTVTVERLDALDAAAAADVLRSAAGGRLEGTAGAAYLRWLSTDDPRVRRELLRGLWGARVSPAVEGRLLELHRSAPGDERHDVLYFALSTLEGKSKAVVAALAVATDEPQDAQRAVWGLAHGVAPEAASAAADALLVAFERHAELRADALRGLVAYGTRAHADRLAALVRDAPLLPGMRREVDAAVETMRSRP
jgi:parallel beta-helix repeat protein